MNTVSKRLVIIASFCLSAALCHADTVATQPVPLVVTAVPAEKPSEVLKSQATAPVATASQGYRAKAIDKLRGLWGAYKATSTKELGRAALGCAGSALRYGYKGFKFALGVPYKLNKLLYSLLLPAGSPERLAAILSVLPAYISDVHFLSIFSLILRSLGVHEFFVEILYGCLTRAYCSLNVVEAFYEAMTALTSSSVKGVTLLNKVSVSVVYVLLMLLFSGAVIGNVAVVYKVFYPLLADLLGFYTAAAPAADACGKVAGGMDGALNFFKSSLDSMKNKNITIDTVKKAYKFLSLKFHPDKGGSPEDFIKLQNAFECLKTA